MKVINLNDELKFAEVRDLITVAMLLKITVHHFTMGTCRGWLYVYADDSEVEQFKAIADRFNFLQYDPTQQGDTDEDF
ncbi:hypothetical protein FHW77_001953 [Agrobacterium sp. RC10-4-1]|uniref:hypothetical protein n=1 Tax=Agrobacterium sp. RC10-4-1 TaxID=2587039 RepID=UPI0015F84AE2|nr:hypothetical protein [Agrobacterium sp. RC10-4-1]MBA8798247.1 hypothetical protein [Agrobacterium sp. RC10-4-1]